MYLYKIILLIYSYNIMRIYITYKRVFKFNLIIAEPIFLVGVGLNIL